MCAIDTVKRLWRSARAVERLAGHMLGKLVSIKLLEARISSKTRQKQGIGGAAMPMMEWFVRRGILLEAAIEPHGLPTRSGVAAKAALETCSCPNPYTNAAS